MRAGQRRLAAQPAGGRRIGGFDHRVDVARADHDLAGAQQIAVLPEMDRHRAAGVEPAGETGEEAGGHVLHDHDRGGQPAGQARQQRAEGARTAGGGADDDERHLGARGGMRRMQPAARMADDADARGEQQAGPQILAVGRVAVSAGALAG